MVDSSMDVVVTGVGPVTAIGVGGDALWSSLAAGRSNVTQRDLVVDVGRMETLAMSSMPKDADVPGLAPHVAFLAGQDCTGYRDAAYALLAMELALTDAGIEYDRSDNDVGAIQAFEAPGSERTVASLFELLAMPLPIDGPPPVYDLLSPRFYQMQPFLYVHLLGKGLGLHGFSTSVHNACTSGAFALELAAQRIRCGLADVMIVVGGESYDTGVRLEWFRRLDLYAKDERMCPFDSTASGFFVGEGAGAIVLESAAHAEKRGATPYAVYRGGAFAQQGWKQVIPDVRSARLATVITEALGVAGVTGSDLDLVVPHGAGTLLSDGYEAACLGTALKGTRDHAVVTAFKPYVGHMLAASAIIDTVCALLAMKHKKVPATLHSSPDATRLPIPLVTKALDRPINNLLKLSTGFTGHDAAMVFTSP